MHQTLFSTLNKTSYRFNDYCALRLSFLIGQVYDRELQALFDAIPECCRRRFDTMWRCWREGLLRTRVIDLPTSNELIRNWRINSIETRKWQWNMKLIGQRFGQCVTSEENQFNKKKLWIHSICSLDYLDQKVSWCSQLYWTVVLGKASVVFCRNRIFLSFWL